MVQNVKEFIGFIHQMIRDTTVETTECYEMIYKLIQAPTFRNILIQFVD